MLKKIANHLRAMDLFYHNAHNLVKGAVFFQDHCVFGEFYAEVGCDYDAVIERAITLEGEESANLKDQLKQVFKILNKYPCTAKQNKEYYANGLKLEKELCLLIEKYIKSECSVAVENMLGNIADKSDVRQYKITQRLK